MIVINFSHPLTPEQIKKIEEMLGEKIEVKNIPVQFDNDKPFETQVKTLVEKVGFSTAEWQTLPILIVPPALSYIAVTLQAALHGIMGYFAPIIRIKPVRDALTVRFEVAEIINLQDIRQKFRLFR